jgi:hypothetical protein
VVKGTDPAARILTWLLLRMIFVLLGYGTGKLSRYALCRREQETQH